MIFNPITHEFADELSQEVEQLGNFASDITCFQANEVIEIVNNQVQVIFDDINAPYVKSTMENLKRLLDELYGRYIVQASREAREMVRIIEDWRRALEEGPQLNWEMLEYPLFSGDNQFEDPSVRNDMDRLKKAILGAHEDYSIKGDYNHSCRTITLYTRNIEPIIDDYISVFAHEYFHAVHHHLIDAHSRERTSRYYHSVVLESLATYFQIEYLHNKGNALSQEIEMDIHRHMPFFYPYSGAKYFFYMGNGQRFCDILEASLYNFEEALRRLIPDHCEAEMIIKKGSSNRMSGKSRRWNGNSPFIVDSDYNPEMFEGENIVKAKFISHPSTFAMNHPSNTMTINRGGYTIEHHTRIGISPKVSRSTTKIYGEKAKIENFFSILDGINWLDCKRKSRHGHTMDAAFYHIQLEYSNGAILDIAIPPMTTSPVLPEDIDNAAAILKDIYAQSGCMLHPPIYRQ